MGFFKSIKDKLGIAGVSVSLETSGHVDKNEHLSGSLQITTKSDQDISGIKIKVLEELTSGRGDNKKTSEFILGKLNLPDPFSITKGEAINLPFTLPFEASKSAVSALAEKNGVKGTIGKLGKFASNEKSSYFVIAEVDVKSAVLDPSDKVEIKIF